MQGTVVDYTILRGTSRQALERLVREQLREGWELQGGVHAIKQGYEHYIYHQAMVKKESEIC